MIGNSLITQIGIAGVAIGIFITYTQPTITVIQEHQDSIVQTTTELEKVNEVNKRLSDLVTRTNAISQGDKALLRSYLPEHIDDVLVLKHLSTIAENVGIQLDGLAYEGESNTRKTDEENLPVVHSFTLSFSSSYEELRDFLSILETNNYPLDIFSIKVTPSEGGELTTDMELITYSHQSSLEKK